MKRIHGVFLLALVALLAILPALLGVQIGTSARCTPGILCEVGDSRTTAIQLNTDGASLGVDVTANTATLTATTTSTAVFTGADAAGAANTTYDTTGAGAITVGSADVTVVTIQTDDTGDGTDLVLPANGVDASEIGSIVTSHVWYAADLTADGTQCAAPGSVAFVTSGPTMPGILCGDNDAGTIQGLMHMPDSWDGGTVTFTVGVVQTGATTDAWEMDFEGQCIGDGEDFLAFSGTGEQPAQITLVADDDYLEATTAAVTLNGTTCAGGDVVAFQGAMDATASGSTLTAEIISVKMEYTSTVGD